MEKKEAQDLTKAIQNLVNVIKDRNKINDKTNQVIRENTEVMKDLRTRLSSLTNVINNNSVNNT